MTSITITGLDELGVTHSQIAQLYQKLNGDLTPLMQAIGGVLESSTTERFTTKQSPNGEYWANLMSSTVARKTNANGDKGGILVESGDLMRSITYHANKDSVTVGTPETYGVYHQFGAKKRNGEDMPARPFLGLSNDDKQDIYAMINDYLMGD